MNDQPRETSTPAQQPAERQGPPQQDLRSVHTTSLTALLNQLGISLLVSTYQAGKLIAVSAREDRVNTHFRGYECPMGLALDGRRLAMATRTQIWELWNFPQVAPKLEPKGVHDACFIPRRSWVTGDTRTHEMAYVNGELWFVNTRFSCLCTLGDDCSFVPMWKPPFISAYSNEDRCHLNGMAVVDGKIKYVTALGQTDTAGGWRQNKVDGGCLIDVESGQTLMDGLSMPHSPHWHGQKLWLLESGKGSLSVMDSPTSKPRVVAELPGFTRGLDFHGRLAFIGLSQVRETAIFGGLPITERLKEDERKCGVWVVDVPTGRTVAFLEFQAGVQEIFDVRVLRGIRSPEMLDFWDQTIHHTFVVRPEVLPLVQEAKAPENESAAGADPAGDESAET